tara:strand:+ start:132 stop:1304 length:1173 start_codon:yes stop_codon:yes gene_type:complete
MAESYLPPALRPKSKKVKAKQRYQRQQVRSQAAQKKARALSKAKSKADNLKQLKKDVVESDAFQAATMVGSRGRGRPMPKGRAAPKLGKLKLPKFGKQAKKFQEKRTPGTNEWARNYEPTKTYSKKKGYEHSIPAVKDFNPEIKYKPISGIGNKNYKLKKAKAPAPSKAKKGETFKLKKNKSRVMTTKQANKTLEGPASPARKAKAKDFLKDQKARIKSAKAQGIKVKEPKRRVGGKKIGTGTRFGDEITRTDMYMPGDFRTYKLGKGVRPKKALPVKARKKPGKGDKMLALGTLAATVGASKRKDAKDKAAKDRADRAARAKRKVLAPKPKLVDLPKGKRIKKMKKKAATPSERGRSAVSGLKKAPNRFSDAKRKRTLEATKQRRRSSY